MVAKPPLLSAAWTPTGPTSAGCPTPSTATPPCLSPGAWAARPDAGGTRRGEGRGPGEAKLLPDLRAAFERIPIRDGMTSFHHHLRDGDGVVCAVLATAAELGLRDLRIAPSAVFGVHAPLVEHIRSGW